MLVFEGRVPEASLEAHVRMLIRRSFKADHDQWGAISLDTPIFRDGNITLGDRVTAGLWQ
jgi:hypothetical protein